MIFINESRITNHESRPPKGFSLIELLFTVVVIGILAAVVIPRVTSGDLYNKFLVYTTAHQVAADLRLTRRLAITNSDDYKLEFTGDTYAIYKDNGGAWDKVSEDKTVDDSIARTGPASVTFSPTGASGVARTFKFNIGSVRYQAAVIRTTGSVVLETY
ncbi:MAG: prepilin-type N-terminal cleavage/methylation domain-containing protein [Candidatus Aadella gelida]|nr:prepilin-type N-terminal cleavage/methylation domain-containing protein [Candidatus Aadella gelida]